MLLAVNFASRDKLHMFRKLNRVFSLLRLFPGYRTSGRVGSARGMVKTAREPKTTLEISNYVEFIFRQLH